MRLTLLTLAALSCSSFLFPAPAEARLQVAKQPHKRAGGTFCQRFTATCVEKAAGKEVSRLCKRSDNDHTLRLSCRVGDTNLLPKVLAPLVRGTTTTSLETTTRTSTKTVTPPAAKSTTTQTISIASTTYTTTTQTVLVLGPTTYAEAALQRRATNVDDSKLCIAFAQECSRKCSSKAKDTTCRSSKDGSSTKYQLLCSCTDNRDLTLDTLNDTGEQVQLVRQLSTVNAVVTTTLPIRTDTITSSTSRWLATSTIKSVVPLSVPTTGVISIKAGTQDFKYIGPNRIAHQYFARGVELEKAQRFNIIRHPTRGYYQFVTVDGQWSFAAEGPEDATDLRFKDNEEGFAAFMYMPYDATRQSAFASGLSRNPSAHKGPWTPWVVDALKPAGNGRFELLPFWPEPEPNSYNLRLQFFCGNLNSTTFVYMAEDPHLMWKRFWMAPEDNSIVKLYWIADPAAA